MTKAAVTNALAQGEIRQRKNGAGGNALQKVILMEEIDAISRKRTYGQVPSEPAASGQPRLAV